MEKSVYMDFEKKTVKLHNLHFDMKDFEVFMRKFVMLKQFSLLYFDVLLLKLFKKFFKVCHCIFGCFIND